MHILAIIFIILYILWFIGKYKEVKEKLQVEDFENARKYCRYIMDKYYGRATFSRDSTYGTAFGGLGKMADDLMKKYGKGQC